ncbi:hypothetical protein [Streptomyces sp. NPDC048560]|uniref:hypothetical protein n=1 Tax=Streptomyces sp. NPDC048560 TaxID=3155488 RepID=UPI003444DA0A
MTMANRRGMNWKLESAPWAAGKARTAVLEQLAKWDHQPAPTVGATIEAVTTMMVDTAVADGGTRVSLHLSDQDGQACIVALSHRTALPADHDGDGDDVLRRITAHRAVTGCGTDTGPDGRRLWAVIAL